MRPGGLAVFTGDGEVSSGPRTVATPPNGPTGQVNNSIGGVATTSFVTDQSGTTTAAHFIFANLNGTISAWNRSE